MYVLDLWRAQTSADKWIETFCDLVRQWKPIGWAEEQGQIRAGVGPFLERRMRERQAYVARAQFPTRGDKAVRAQSIRGRMERALGFAWPRMDAMDAAANPGCSICCPSWACCGLWNKQRRCRVLLLQLG
jgi:hypothetical protein